MSTIKSHLLDPLNVIFKLALLNICESGTRLSINSHIVQIQRPTNKYIQALYRIYNSDGRNDLYLLLKSIVKIVEWYTTEYTEIPTVSKPEPSDKDHKESKHPKFSRKKNEFYKDERLKSIIQFACRGLEKLQKFYEQHYEDGIFMIAIQLMINVMKDGIDGKLDIERLPVNYRKLDAVSLVHIQEIIKFWKTSNIDKILRLLSDSEKYINDVTEENQEGNRIILNGYIETILSILQPLDFTFQKIVEKSYS